MTDKNPRDLTGTQKITEAGKEEPRLLAVDDDPLIRKMLFEILAPQGYHIDLSESSGDALEKLIDYKYHLLLLDANLPGISGFELLKYCKKHHPAMEIIMITGNPELEDAISTVKDGAFDYIAKPFSIEKLQNRVKDALKQQKERLSREVPGSGVKQYMNDAAMEQPLPNYRVIRTLGAGTMGVVLLVERDSKQYALKILRREGDSSVHTSRVKRFLREAQILSQIEHPNIVKIHESGFPRTGDVPYILMEYIEGRPLTDYIKNGSLKLESKLHIISQISSALSIVHKHGILHRDIKPSNILIKNDLTAKLTDFGIARVSDSSLTMTHEVLGSPAYMPPESFNPKLPIDARSDIFSLGILSYELITGSKPFHGETVAEMMSAIQSVRPKEPRKLDPSIPQPVQDFLANMLYKNPDDRFQNAAKIVQTINNLGRKTDDMDTKSRSFFRAMLGGGRVWE